MEPAEEEKARKSYKRSALQGPRPPPLKISKAGIEKIGMSKQQQHQEQPPQQQQQRQRQQPVIIYTRSPEVIHTKPQDFMQLVQRLTGPSCSKKKKKKKSREKTRSQVMPEPHLTTFKSPSEFISTTITTTTTTSSVFPSFPAPAITPSQLYSGLLSPFPISPLPPFSPSLFTISPLRYSYSPLQFLDTPSYFTSCDQIFPPPVKDTDQSNNVP
ncbi:nuclear speckle RNA-binding protein B-like [Cryptomeria japonica]|uniref:nuclear speckle RNA-binding protein B-like n=1 Tax=Cryptomeria japonica TaxID=3369 RepID=UPI0027DA7960|nr:nuclear speckle RNA-binding protein B-like [Cryptomeria japonica]